MKFFLTMLSFFLLLNGNGIGQSPIKMLYQPGLSYTETFSDIKNWNFNPNNDGTLKTGLGASAWKGLAPSATGTIPSPSIITTNTTYFVSLFNSGVQLDTLGQSLLFLTSGTTDNSNAAAMDMYADYTNTTAGTLSFSWKSVNNFSGDRKASLRVYGSIDGLTFEELVGAQVLNLTNNVATNGNVVNVALPVAFNNAPNARLRFYCYNGTGGAFGSRPKISIDNITLTATVATACLQPTAGPTAISLSTITDSSISASFTPSVDLGVNSYIIVQSYNASLTSLPLSGNYYAIGNNIGDGEVISIAASTGFTAKNLYPATKYYFTVFAAHFGCTGGPLYETTNKLSADTTTLAGNNTCAIPATQPTTLAFTNIATNGASGYFNPSIDADEYLVVRCSTPSLSANPTKGLVYRQGDLLGNGVVVSQGPSSSFLTTNLTPATTYYLFVFAIKSLNCNSGPAYNTTLPLTSNFVTPALTACIAPTTQPDLLQMSASSNIIHGFFKPSTTADSYLILYSTVSTLSAIPLDGNNYTTGNTIGGGTVLSNNSATAFVASNLNPATTYYFFVFAANSNCLGGTKYLITNPLTIASTTTGLQVYNYYSGNLHAHSSYSDGNKDNLSYTPAFDYNYAKNSLCMDFLGISDHNHSGAGMSKSSWQPGLAEAKSATSSTFLALYGMEWGIISGGGHVVVYGSDKLFGWESNNYDVYVPINDYTGTSATTGTKGLFKTINETGTNTFGTLAHPYVNDFNNLHNIPYDSNADSALVGVAIQSGPAFSTNTSYSDISYFEYLPYYSYLLAKGYHVGPTIDHDNHYTTFGRTTKSRLIVIAPTIDSASFYTAMKSRNFYATEDCDMRVSFTINNHMMGSILADNSAPAIAINVYDATPATPAGNAIIRLMYGVPGSGQNAIEIAKINGSTLTFTDLNLPILSKGYYYADISMSGNGARIITSPIWYTKTDNISPLTLLSFSAAAQSNRTVNITWKTTAEVNVKSFIIERSTDGRTFSSIALINSSGQLEGKYEITDVNPNGGANYYRLKIIDLDGTFSYSQVVSINFKNIKFSTFKIVENPMTTHVKLNIFSNENQVADIYISDASGRISSMNKTSLWKGNQTVTVGKENLHAGTYFLTIVFQKERVTNKFVKY